MPILFTFDLRQMEEYAPGNSCGTYYFDFLTGLFKSSEFWISSL